MMKRSLLLLFALTGIVIWLGGCKVSDKGTPLANQPPSAVLTFAPQNDDTVNHFVPIHWAGNDPDGVVSGFMVIVGDSVDATLRLDTAFTASADTLIAFAAPQDSALFYHTFEVRAIDDDGALSPVNSGNTRQFYVFNYAPTAAFDSTTPGGNVPPGANVGRGFRMTLVSSDPNPSSFTYCVAIDTAADWICSPFHVFLFGDPTLDVVPPLSQLVSNDRLTAGSAHTIYAKVIDAGGATSAVISRTVHVLADQVPRMSSTVTGTYPNTDSPVYRDGSVYYARNAEAKLVWSADAVLYYGEINAYRHQVGDSAWSAWVDNSAVVLNNLPVGDYTIRSIARDLAGSLTDTVATTLHIVEQHLSTRIIIVDETRDGTGVPGSPNDAQVDDFYSSLFDGATQDSIIQIDYATQGYVSPMNLKDAGLVMWHSDDRTDFHLDDNTRVLTQFLNRGGRLMLSGWDLMAPLVTANGFSPDSVAVFHSGDIEAFPYNMMHCETATRNGTRTATGFSGQLGYPGCSIDSAKVPTVWAGTIDKTWTFQPRGEANVIGRLTVNNPDVNPLAGRPAAYIYDLSFRVAVFGVPLYFCRTDDVMNLLRNPNNDPNFVGIVNQMLFGL